MKTIRSIVSGLCVFGFCVLSDAFGQTLRYVWTNSPAPAAPYTAWSSAAHTIQEAVDACATGDLVLVTNGVYDTGSRAMPDYTASCRVVITNGVRVVSVNGSEVTIIRGEGPVGASAVRCAYLSGGALLSGFTLTNGCSNSSGWQYFDGGGGGAFIRQSGTLSNCVVSGCEVWRYGGGVMCSAGGLVVDCVVAGNLANNYGASGGGIFLHIGGAVHGCTIANNQAYWNGGGVDVSYSGAVVRCEIRGNTAIAGDGGGVELYYGGSLSHCRIYNNHAGGTTEYDGGGGVSCFFGGHVTNCAFYGNSSASQGGGAKGTFGGAFVNCSFFDNEAPAGGGVYCNYYVTNFNNVIYHNRALNGPNFATNGNGNVFVANCATPLPAPDGGNITNAPLLAGVANWHLLTNSPCVDAGSNSFAAGIAADLDGEPRILGAAVDMGCDEFFPAGLTGAVSVAIRAAYTQAVVNIPLTFYSDVQGKIVRTWWSIQTGGAARSATNTFSERQAWPAPGLYQVVLTALNNGGRVSATVSVQVVSSFVNYAAKDGTAVAPYTNWATAATSLYEAVLAAPPGGVTFVSNGVFEEDREIAIDKPCEIRSVNGPGLTAVSGRGLHRVFHIEEADVRLHGLAIVQGFEDAAAGGGVRMDLAGVLSNCWIVGCQSVNNGGGVYLSGGAEMIGCLIASNGASSSGGGAYFDQGGSAQGCRFEHNTANNYGGGVYLNRGGAADDGLFLGNEAGNGGGGAYCNYGGSMRNGRYLDNVGYNGGGIYFYYGGGALNPHVAGNRADQAGGGVYIYGSVSAICANATIQGNTAGVRGGGVFASSGGRIRNSIVYYNEAPMGANFYNDYSGYQYDTCCMTPSPSSGGVNIMTNAPLFSGGRNPHLMAGSRCLDAGSNVYAEGIAVDVDSEPRTNNALVDIGCDEYWSAGMTGTLTVAILATYTTAVANTPLSFMADVQGKANSIVWRVGDVGVTNRYTNELSVAHAWASVGAYRVILAASNASGGAAATVTVTIVQASTNYVDAANASPVAPYTNWAMAAVNLQEALDAAPVGGTVLITNGLYNQINEVLVEKPVTIRSVNGPDTVTVDAQGNQRVFNVNASGVLLSGLTVTNGITSGNGGGVLCGAGTIVTNCRIVNCQAVNGGGVYFDSGGALYNSRLDYNLATTAGGGVYCLIGGHVQACSFYSNNTTSSSSGGGGGAYVHTIGTILDCVFTNNRTSYRGGAAHLYYGGVVSNCLAAGNKVVGWSSSIGGGGFCLTYGGLAQNCTISNNLSDSYGGGAYLHYGGTVQDCEIVTNVAKNGGGGGAYIDTSGTLRNNRIARNNATWNNGGGIWFARGGLAVDCVIEENWAANDGGGAYVVRSGLVLTNCQLNGNMAEQGGGLYISGYGRVVNSSFMGNQGEWAGGGAYLGDGGVLYGCLLGSNMAPQGGGVAIVGPGVVSNSVLTGNIANEGGAINIIFDGRVYNSYLGGNLASNKGGGLCLSAWGSAAEVGHCTIVNNMCHNQGGGSWADAGGAIRNSIVYDNQAVFGPNWYNDGAGPAYANCCVTPDPGGAGNIANAPLLAGLSNPHLLTNSPCVDAGDNAWAVGLDIDIEARIGGAAADMGCDEVHATNLMGAISAAIVASATNAVVQTPLTFVSDVQGRIAGLVWSVDTGSGWVGATNQPAIERAWNAPGDYAVVLAAWNATDYDAATVTVHVMASMTNYVAPGGAHVWPFASWANASTSIAEAVAASAAGGLVLVSNGIYREAPAVFVEHPLTIRGANGWAHTTMDGQGTNRCFFLLDTNVLIEGFTFSNAMARADVFGGGGAVVLNEGGIVRHCRFVNCNAAQYGGGVVCYYGGSVQNCWFTGNTAMFGGGVLCYHGGEVVNSTLADNRALAQGGGVYCEGGGTVRNSILYYNHAAMGANWLNVGSNIVYENVCATPLPSGVGNFATEPGLASLYNPHLLTNAPCVNAGSNEFASGIAKDCDYEARVLGGRVDVGCDEFYPAGLTGTLFVAIAGATFDTVPGLPLDLWAVVAGKPARTEWRAETGAGLRVVTNALLLSQSWSATGDYPVVLRAYNNSGGAAVTVTVSVAGAGVLYVATNGLHVAPFTNWVAAATNIGAAIAAAAAGDTILVSNGWYAEGAELILDKPVLLSGLNGPEVTIASGGNAHRVFRLDHPQAVLDGFGVTQGDSQNSPGAEGGGVVLNGGGRVVNCHVYSNRSPKYAGGVLLYGAGVVSNCVIRGNESAEGGGAQLFNGGLVTHSRILYNRATSRGGGASLLYGGTVSNCAIQGNDCNIEGGGVAFYEAGVCVDSAIETNEAAEGGGAYFYVDGSLINCVVASNFAWSMGGGARTYQGGLIRNCDIYRNAADFQWGFGRGGGVYLRLGGTVESCTIVENQAGAGQGGGVVCNSGGTVLNSIVYSNSTENVTGADQGTFGYCCVEPAPAGTVNFTNDPQLVDWTALNHRLQSNSPCVEQGLNQAWMTNAVDLDRTARVKNLYADIGAYESVWSVVDTDGDGLPVGVERSQFGTSDLLADTDGDRQGDFAEAMVTGTSPTNAADYFRGIIDRPASPRTVVYWPSITGRMYRLETATGLVAGVWRGVPGWTNLTGRSGYMYYTNPYTDPMRHFRPSVIRTNW